MVRAGRVYAIHTDHLGTPRLITDERQRTLWQWSYSAFGANAPTGLLRDDRPRIQTPGAKLIADGGAQLRRTEPRIEMNLRFAGQYRDAESGLFDNWHRAYIPGGARYAQPDPSGLAGGMNVYAYAANNALTFVDPDAFAPKDPNAKPAPLPMSSVSGSGGAGGGVSKFDAPIKPIPFPGAIMGAWCQPRGGAAAGKGAAALSEVSIGARATRNSANQLNVNLTQSQANENLVANGYVKTMSKDGTVTIMTNGDKVYRFYPQSTGGGVSGASAGVPSASVSILDKMVTKLRFIGE